MTTTTVTELDGLIELAREEAKRLHDMHKSWADQKAHKFERMVVVLAEVRRDKQMTGMNGRRIEG